jgi:uncharacterized membrane protein YphA (DoxX/SURF4 family)
LGIRSATGIATLLSGGIDPHAAVRRSPNLQRLFSTFPSGWPGIGLLLLRVAVGAAAVIQGGAYLAAGGTLTLWTGAVGLVAFFSGASLVLGFLTPISSGLVGLGAIGNMLSWFPPPSQNLFDAALPTVLVAIVAAAVVFLGPGSLSIDARLFGRREIIIPRSSHSSKL